jgi:putative SOS response-associated peptidase YedK
MCGRFTLNSSSEALVNDFELSDVPLLAPRFNIAPSQDIAVVRENDAGVRECVPLRWGLIPYWSKDPKKSNAPINARSETAATKPSFRQAMAQRRCLVPATGFYEWQAVKGGVKQPYLFRPRDQGLFAIGGLFESWSGEGGEIIESVALLTTEANAVVGKVHKRMPVIVARGDYARWLDRGNCETASVEDLFGPSADDLLEACAVSTKVNNPRFDEPACVDGL